MASHFPKLAVWSVLGWAVLTGGLSRSQAGPIRPGFDAAALPAADDESSKAVDLGFAVNFFGQSFASVYVNTNGNISLGAPLSDFTPVPLGQLRQAVIAPFFADVDTTGTGLITYGTGTVDGRPAFGATWSGVGHYDARSDQRNSFQAVLVDRSDTGAGNFDLEFNYDQIQWESGDFNGGVNGRGGSSARVGVSGEGTTQPGTYYELPGSGIPGSFLDSGTVALAARMLNSSTAGRTILISRTGTFQNLVVVPDPVSGPITPDPGSVGVVGAPEPGTLALTALGLGGVAIWVRVSRQLRVTASSPS